MTIGFALGISLVQGLGLGLMLGLSLSNIFLHYVHRQIGGHLI